MFDSSQTFSHQSKTLPTSNNQPIYSQEQVDQLFRGFSKRLELDRQTKINGTKIPVEIIKELELWCFQNNKNSDRKIETICRRSRSCAPCED
jgi:hypothetical protein